MPCPKCPSKDDTRTRQGVCFGCTNRTGDSCEGVPIDIRINGRTCPMNRFRGDTVWWAGLEWYGVPFPLRVWAWAMHAKHPKPSLFAGCGCLVELKGAIGNPMLAQRLTRHADIKTTQRSYVDAEKLGLSQAINSVFDQTKGGELKADLKKSDDRPPARLTNRAGRPDSTDKPDQASGDGPEQSGTHAGSNPAGVIEAGNPLRGEPPPSQLPSDALVGHELPDAVASALAAWLQAKMGGPRNED